jgi:mRNA-degrading endonuclease RelE of RelBE toxin-antitoxin system
VPVVDFSLEGKAQFKALPRAIKEELNEIFPWLEKNPLKLPPWVDVKLLGESRGKKVLRVRVRGFRAIFTFDGQIVTLVRVRVRPEIKYGALPKA